MASLTRRSPPRESYIPWAVLALFLTANVVFLLSNNWTESSCSNGESGVSHVRAPVVTAPMDPADEVSACLCVMDDNHFLTEWLAYHYHTANLRNVIIASDPKSLTKPTRVLDRWRDRMNIVEWKDDDFLGKDFDANVEKRTSGAKRRKDPTLQNHRARQATFNLECLRTFKRQNKGWVLMIDTDEYLSINQDLRDPEFHAYDETLDLPPIEEPGSILTFLQQVYIPYPDFELMSPCLPVYRRQFAARESEDHRVNALLPAGFNGKDFQTLRWRRYGHRILRQNTTFGVCHSGREVPNKVIMDLGRMRMEDLENEDNTGNPHRPLASCERDVYWRQEDTPLMANHFMGTMEQWLYRVGDRRGKGYRMARYKDINSRVGNTHTDEIRPWLLGFVASVGHKEAARLLDGVGVLEPLPGQASIEEPVEEVEDADYHTGELVQADYKGDGIWRWAEIGDVLGGGFYNVFYPSCREEIATFSARLKRSEFSAVDDDFEMDFRSQS